jgi:hypothetical protein
VLAAAATAIAAVIPCPHPRLALVGLRDYPGGARHAVDHRLQEEQQPTACQGIFIVDPDSGSVDLSTDGVDWDDERGILALRKYYALRHEAEDAVTESKRLWSDTPFSVYALQGMSFLFITLLY